MTGNPRYFLPESLSPTISEMAAGSFPGHGRTTQAGAESALGYADQALQNVTSNRSTIGAVTNGISSEIQGLQSQYTNAIAANSRIADTDIAREMVSLTNQSIQSQVAIKTFQVNDAMRQSVLKLLG